MALWQVTASSDDCFRRYVGNYWSLTGTRLYAGNVSPTSRLCGCGMRFMNIAIPKDATITSAYLTLRCGAAESGTVCNTRISAEAVDDPPTFSTEADFDTRRLNSTSKVDWNGLPAWELNVDYNSPEIKTVIQEIVDRAGWESGNDIVLFWEDWGGLSDDGARRQCHAFDGSAEFAPKLIITWGVEKELAGTVAIKSATSGILITPYDEIPPLMEKDLIDPFASGAWLWLVQIVLAGQDTVRIARDTADVHYNGNDFDKFNLQIAEQMFSGDGSIPRVTLRVFQDINRKVEDLINATEGALGAQVKLIRVNEKFLTSPVAALEFDYDNLASESDSGWCTFTLGIPNPLTQRFPLRNYSSSMCPEAHPDLFKGPVCQYVGGDTSCTGTYEDCYVKGNAVHWGAELGLSPSVVTKVNR